MNKLKLLIPLIILLLNSGCASFGPTVRFETAEPAEDFIVLCQWYKNSGFISHGGGRSRSDHKVFITKSGEEVDCGMSPWGGKGGMTWMHPLYTGGDGASVEEIDGVKVIRPITVLQRLDELKAKFEAGFWDKRMNPGAAYADDLVGCGFPHQYFDYYSEVKHVDKEHFKKLYNDDILECKKRVFPVFNKYLSRAYSGKRPSPEESMNNLWSSDGWGKYE